MAKGEHPDLAKVLVRFWKTQQTSLYLQTIMIIGSVSPKEPLQHLGYTVTQSRNAFSKHPYTFFYKFELVEN